MPSERITFNPNRMGGQACIRGMRLPVSTIVRCVASGMTQAEIPAAYPELEAADIAASLLYAAQLTEDRLLSVLPTASSW